MSPTPSDGFLELAQASTELAVDYPGSVRWESSPFKWLLSISSASRGKVGRQLVAAWAAESGFNVHPIREHGQLYLEVNGLRIQVKTSTLWKSGFYRFQQIRDMDYDYCLCLGLSPDDAHMWLIPKEALDIHVIGQLGQHTGAGSNETYWLNAGPGLVQRWLEPFGNDPAQVKMRLAEAAGIELD